MIDLHDAVNLLQAKRNELADQLDAVDKALAALTARAGEVSDTPEKNPAATTETDSSVVLPIRDSKQEDASTCVREA